MKIINFDTDVLPPADRLSAFRSAASDFVVDPMGDTAFRARWALLALTEINVILSDVTPLRYRRNRLMIEADARDRVAVHYYLEGGAEGCLDGRSVRVDAGAAMVWDLSRPIDCSSTGRSRLIILTLPRFTLDEALFASSYSCLIKPSFELSLLVDHLQFILLKYREIPEEVEPNLGRSVRDLLVNAISPVVSETQAIKNDASAPLLRRITNVIDARLKANPSVEFLGNAVDETVEEVRACVAAAGGLPLLIERRRLLAGYCLLRDPDVALSVSEIAFRCGIGDATRFTHGFTNVFGSAPTEVRRRARGDLPNWAGAYPVTRFYGSFLK